MEETAKIRKRFGDEQSTLLDQFERLSLEAHLNRAMLQRSLSEPGFPRSVSQSSRLLISSVAPTTTTTTVPPLVTHEVKQGRSCRPSPFHKVLKKLLKPFIGTRKRGDVKKHGPDPKNPLSWKAFSRSMRF